MSQKKGLLRDSFFSPIFQNYVFILLSSTAIKQMNNDFQEVQREKKNPSLRGFKSANLGSQRMTQQTHLRLLKDEQIS